MVAWSKAADSSSVRRVALGDMPKGVLLDPDNGNAKYQFSPELGWSFKTLETVTFESVCPLECLALA